MRDATFDESGWTETDDRLDQLLTAAHNELVDTIETVQNASITRDHARAAARRNAVISHALGGTAVLPSHLADDGPTSPSQFVPVHNPQERQPAYSFSVPEAAVIGPALEAALKALEDLLASLRDAANSSEMSEGFRIWTSQGVQRNVHLMQMLVERTATLLMAEEFFAEVMSQLAVEQVFPSKRRRYVELVALLRASHDAVTYLFEESDDHELVLV
ncbi:hypothetical protein [Streptomyces hawaiiensis]|uniref:hypothetical protein n=1 Tax=Streptomyces hawaiiensis TaxID=67305 RepID=UPI00366064EC